MKFREKLEDEVRIELIGCLWITDYIQGMFKANPAFVMAMFVHALLLEAAAWWLLYSYGNTWTTWIISGILLAASQVQHGWLQHDLVHGAVFPSSKVNHLFNDISLGLLQV